MHSALRDAVLAQRYSLYHFFSLQIYPTTPAELRRDNVGELSKGLPRPLMQADDRCICIAHLCFDLVKDGSIVPISPQKGKTRSISYLPSEVVVSRQCISLHFSTLSDVS
jgi:hypothetical protein